MLKRIFKKLDKWIEAQNRERRMEGGLHLEKATIRVLGQMALIEAELELDLAGTVDLDAAVKADGAVRLQLENFLKEDGLILDIDAEKIWMPEETEYEPLFQGKFVEASLAKAEYVMLSKAKKAPKKNAALLTQYLAEHANEHFLALAKKYEVDLEEFL